MEVVKSKLKNQPETTVLPCDNLRAMCLKLLLIQDHDWVPTGMP